MAAHAADPLPALNVDLLETSVSGLSSGAYMAGQFHVAYSGTVGGAGVIAGGPYDCAEGQLSVALNRCMLKRDDQDENGATIRMRESRRAGSEAPAEPCKEPGGQGRN